MILGCVIESYWGLFIGSILGFAIVDLVKWLWGRRNG